VGSGGGVGSMGGGGGVGYIKKWALLNTGMIQTETETRGLCSILDRENPKRNYAMPKNGVGDAWL